MLTHFTCRVMLALRNFRFMPHILYKHSTKHTDSVHSLRRLTSTSTVPKQSKDDLPINMENPYKEPPKGCILCNTTVDYRNVQLLSQFISPHTGRIYGRHITGLCGRKQKEVTKAVKKARHMGFMPVTLKDPCFMKDPNICNIKHLE